MSDRSNNPVKRALPASRRSRLGLSLLLFALVAVTLLFYPVGRPLEILRDVFHRTTSLDRAFVSLTSGLAVWLGCIGCLTLLWRTTDRLSDSFSYVFTRSVLLAFVLFFAIDRFAVAVLGPHLQWLSYKLQWIQLLSSITAVGVVASLFPHWHGMKEGSGTARWEHARFLASAESSLDDFYIFDGVPDASGEIVDFRFSYINPNAERRLKIRREELLGKVLTEVRPYMISSGLIEKYRQVVRTGIPLTCEVFIDDERIKDTWLNVQVVKLGDGIAVTSRDVTESKRMSEHVQYLAHYDQLTGLANRTLLQDRLHQAILRARRYKHKVALFVVDIDHFKDVNDSLGHAAGDALLIAAGERLVSVGRETDTVARMGGDEFVIVMPDFKTMEDVRRCGLQIVKRAAEPILVEDREVRITVSVGVCTFPDYAQETNQLFKNADAAMYVVKGAGRNGLHVFDEDMMKTDGAEIAAEEDHYRSC